MAKRLIGGVQSALTLHQTSGQVEGRLRVVWTLLSGHPGEAQGLGRLHRLQRASRLKGEPGPLVPLGLVSGAGQDSGGAGGASGHAGDLGGPFEQRTRLRGRESGLLDEGCGAFRIVPVHLQRPPGQLLTPGREHVAERHLAVERVDELALDQHARTFQFGLRPGQFGGRKARDLGPALFGDRGTEQRPGRARRLQDRRAGHVQQRALDDRLDGDGQRVAPWRTPPPEVAVVPERPLTRQQPEEFQREQRVSGGVFKQPGQRLHWQVGPGLRLQQGVRAGPVQRREAQGRERGLKPDAAGGEQPYPLRALHRGRQALPERQLFLGGLMQILDLKNDRRAGGQQAGEDRQGIGVFSLLTSLQAVKRLFQPRAECSGARKGRHERGKGKGRMDTHGAADQAPEQVLAGLRLADSSFAPQRGGQPRPSERHARELPCQGSKSALPEML